MARLLKIAPGEYYHVFNRGVGKKIIFNNNKDRSRFLLLLLISQSPLKFKNTSLLADGFSTNLDINSILDKDEVKEIISQRYVELVCFTLLPNHFHLLVKEKIEGGISKYLHRIETAYTMYFNIRNEISGHLFQGAYKIVHIKNDLQLMHASAYIHRNILEAGIKLSKLHDYAWSSYSDFVGVNRWGEFLERTILIERFSNDKNDTYKYFIETSPAKKEFE